LLSDDPWEKLISEQEFREAIQEYGYYQCPLSFPEYKKKYQLTLKRQTPAYLSIDFWSNRSKTLRDKKLYVIRTGKGRFVIFSEDRFAKPYLDLRIDRTKAFTVKDVQGYKHLKAAFRDNYQEDVNLEHLRMLGIYDQLVSEVCGTDNYLIGPRGGRNSKLKICLNDKEHLSRPAVFDYHGQEELDYTIWTEDSVLVFEAKQTQSSSGGLDIGWHKLAYPCHRFKNYENLNIIPIYYLRRGSIVYLFVFHRMQFHNEGLLLNDTRQFTPIVTFRIDL
jgi:hypothetical protein